MKISYDRTADALYITLREGELVSRTEQVDPGTLVDLDELGRAVGVEVIRPARDWPFDAVLDQFQVDPAAALLLRLVLQRQQGEARRFPFAAQARVAASA